MSRTVEDKARDKYWFSGLWRTQLEANTGVKGGGCIDGDRYWFLWGHS